MRLAAKGCSRRRDERSGWPSGLVEAERKGLRGQALSVPWEWDWPAVVGMGGGGDAGLMGQCGSAVLGCSGIRFFGEAPGFEGPGFEGLDLLGRVAPGAIRQCWFSNRACNGRASCTFDSQKRLARRDRIATTTPCRLSQKRLFEAGTIDSLSVTGKMRRAYARGSRGPLRRRADPYPITADPRAASVPRGRRLKH
jgi:hypothetical protein